ncbi:hypothetical protein NM688_g7623 [Phlebia brevispora]|uniref:Uncharacterized protein n=1 Tax=Phlebia brevispora TaxID=194682 RepID=A0ACC1S395_9APHY|nr:hypothetical protein NM688_g7623 [Phlebia brevispora]
MIVLPDDYKYPIAAIVGTHVLLFWQVVLVENARNLAHIAYPQLYAEKEEAARSKDAMKFNCVQRAHQNMLENVPLLYSSTMIAGLKYPVAAAALLVGYTLTRIPYTLGYKTGDANKAS